MFLGILFLFMVLGVLLSGQVFWWRKPAVSPVRKDIPWCHRVPGDPLGQPSLGRLVTDYHGACGPFPPYYPRYTGRRL